MSVIKVSLPSLSTECLCGRSIDRSFNYKDKQTGESRHAIRKAVQVQFSDAEGLPCFGVAVPVRDWDFDISPLQGKRVRFFVSQFGLSDDSASVLTFCGYDILDAKVDAKKA